MISERASRIQPSATLSITAMAKKMKKQGEDIVILGAGEPDFDTPDNIKDAASKAIKEGFTKYTAASGIDELKGAICEKFRKDNNISYENNNILVSCGAKHSLYNIMQATLNAGDEVILPVPYWVSYYEQIRLAEAKPVFVDTDENFEFTANVFEKAITPKTRMVVLNYPSNPSGAVIPKSELKKIADVAVQNNILVLADEVYEKICYDSEHYSIAALNDEIKELTITFNAVSKTYSMTGWRVGYCAARNDIIKAASNIQSHSTSNPCSIAQKAALEAITGPQDSVKKMVEAFRKRRELVVSKLNTIPGVDCKKPAGSFYVFPDVSKCYNEVVKGSVDFAARLLEKEKVAVIPGEAFGADKNIRISYATSEEQIGKGIDRIKHFVENM